MVILVADGVGCGGAEDAAAYGDAGANTLGNLAARVGGLSLPNLGALGLGHVTRISGVPPAPAPRGAVGAMREASAGKDTITGHWEMAGVVTDQAFPTFPRGFPPEIIGPLAKLAGRPIIGNKPASGTAIIEELGPEHMATGALIVYTSADSVLQIAAHKDIVPVPELHRICAEARTLVDPFRIGRVIARPFVGKSGGFRRTYDRRDWPIVCPEDTLLDHLTVAGVPVIGIGKIYDIFGGRGVEDSLHSEGNVDGMRLTLEALRSMDRGLLFVNLVDFDMLYGHRNDCDGFRHALEDLDDWIPQFCNALGDDDMAFLTADHGNDPTTPGTDHTREHVPLLAFGGRLRPAELGVRASFCDLGQTIADALAIDPLPRGTSFLAQLCP
jgi:phosphopentomutase